MKCKHSCKFRIAHSKNPENTKLLKFKFFINAATPFKTLSELVNGRLDVAPAFPQPHPQERGTHA